MTTRNVCCGYRDIEGKHILCEDPVQREMWLNKLPNDSHGPCDACHAKEMVVIEEINRRRQSGESS